MNCGQCGVLNNASDKFCENCGAILGAGPDMAAAGFGATVVAAPTEPFTLSRLDGSGARPTVLGSRAVIGRLDTCDLPVDDKSVSREHARLSRLRDGYVIEDLGSTNGTLVNGRRIDEAVILRAGDTVTIGSVDFRFDLEHAREDGKPSQAASSWESSASAPAAEAAVPDWVARAADHYVSATSEKEAPSGEPAPPVPSPWAEAVSDPVSETFGDISFPPLEPFAAPSEPDLPEALSADDSPQSIADAGQIETTGTEASVSPGNGSASVEEAASVSDVDGPAEERVPTYHDEDSMPRAESRTDKDLPDTDDSSEVADQFSGYLRDQARQVKESKKSQLQAEEKLASLQSEHDNVTSRLQTLQDADFTRSQRLQSMQEDFKTTRRELELAKDKNAEYGEVVTGIRDLLHTAPNQSVDSESLQELCALLESLARSPKDIDVLTQTAQQASAISSLANEVAQLRELAGTIATKVGEIQVE